MRTAAQAMTSTSLPVRWAASTAAWQTLPAAPAERYPAITLSEFAGRVDRVLLSSEPYPFRQRHIGEIRAALPGVPVQLIDGEMTSWYGSRAIAALDYLRAFTAGDVPATQACA